MLIKQFSKKENKNIIPYTYIDLKHNLTHIMGKKHNKSYYIYITNIWECFKRMENKCFNICIVHILKWNIAYILYLSTCNWTESNNKSFILYINWLFVKEKLYLEGILDLIILESYTSTINGGIFI